MNTYSVLLWCLTILKGVLLVLGSHRGGWGQWSEWSKCTVTCGYGVTSRQRQWTTIKKNYTDIVECWSGKECPVNGGWGMWSSWTDCPVMCDGGVQTRERLCNEPKPQYGGSECYGAKWEGKECNRQKCPKIPSNFTLALCTSSTYLCESREHCVHTSKRCDGVLHCHDGTDEKKCYSYYVTFNNSGRGKGTSLYSNISMLLFVIVIMVSVPWTNTVFSVT